METELGQRYLRNFHVNDDDDLTLSENGEKCPTTHFYDNYDTKHSLLHKVLAYNGQHWKINHVPSLLNVDGHVYNPSSFQRTYTVDGTSIYDFLTGEVAEESGCIFTFDTYKREINCYNLKECVYDKNTDNVVENVEYIDGSYYYKDGTQVDATISKNYDYCDGIGSDTNVFVTKNKLANELQLQPDKDSIKNCFYVTGGDDVINSWVGAATGTGENYIFMFDNFQYEDMPDELSETIQEYTAFLEKELASYNTEGGLFLTYCDSLDKYHCLRHSKFPDTTLETTTAEQEVNKIIDYFTKSENSVIVKTSYSKDSFSGITNTVESMIKVICDSRYKVAILSGVENGESYPRISDDIDDNNTTCTWTGRIKLVRDTDEKDFCTSGDFTVNITKIPLDDYETNDDWCKQRMDIAIAKMSIADLKFKGDETEEELEVFFDDYNFESLKSFYDALQSCMEQLDSLFSNNPASGTYNSMLDTYRIRRDACYKIYMKRGEEVNEAFSAKEALKEEIKNFQDKVNMKSYFLKKENGELLWKYLQCYIREDEYNNSNYFSDGLTDGGLLEKAKELVNAAREELKKACVRQNKISGNINNLFAIDELSTLYDEFNLFNYIRCKVDDKIYKLRIIQVDFDENSPQDLSVTFSDTIESVTGETDDVKSVLEKAASIATSYSSTTRQAKQGADALSTFTNLKNEGLSSADYVINSDESGIVIGRTGILGRSPSDIGEYSDNQIRIAENIIAFTNDAWKSPPKMAIGYTKINDTWLYGVVCDALVGNLIAGEELIISNNDGTGKHTVTIDKNGLSMENGRICLSNKENTITIDPGEKTKNLLFCIHNNNSNKDVFYVDNNGNAHFDGVVNTEGGNIAGWIINSNAIYRTSEFFGHASGMYFGSRGLSITNKFKVESNGDFDFGNGKLVLEGSKLSLGSDVTLTWEQITDADDIVTRITKDTIDVPYLNSLEITAGSVAAENITGSTISGKTITGGEINGSSITGGAINGTFVTTDYLLINGGYGVTLRTNYGGVAPTFTLVDTAGNYTNIAASGATIHGYSVVTSNWEDALNGKIIYASGYRIPSVGFCDTKYQAASDYRLKKNTKSLPNCIDSVFDCLRPIEYEYKEDIGINAWKGKHFGELAQRIDKVMTENGLDPNEYSITDVRELDEGTAEEKYCIDGKLHYINHNEVIWLCVDQIQKLKKQTLQTFEYIEEITSLRQEILKSKEKIGNLYQEIAEMKKIMEDLKE